MPRTKINFKIGGQECPPHTGGSDCFIVSKQLHLQEVTVDLQYENYTMAKARAEAGIRAVFDDKSGTPGSYANGIIRVRDCHPMETLDGKLALVTGGSRGIGASVALALAEAGADVVVNFRERFQDAKKVCTEVQKLGRRTLAIQADVSQSDEVGKMVAQIERELGAVSILVNNAGIARQLKVEDIAESD